MQILGELAFIAFLAAVGRELYRWAQRGRLRYRRMLAAGGYNPSTKRHHIRVAARLFLGAGFFFLLYLIPASAHAADPLADDLIEVGGAVTDETSGLNEVEEPDVVPTVEKIVGAAASPEEDIPSTVLELVEGTVPTPPGVPENPLGEGPSPLPTSPDGPQQEQPTTDGRGPGSSVASAPLGTRRVAGAGRDGAGIRLVRERISNGAPDGDPRSFIDGSSVTFSNVPATLTPAGGLAPASRSMVTAGPPAGSSPGTGLGAEFITAALLGLALLGLTYARRAQGFLCYLAAPLGPPG
jgi:hypothetical protein